MSEIKNGAHRLSVTGRKNYILDLTVEHKLQCKHESIILFAKKAMDKYDSINQNISNSKEKKQLLKLIFHYLRVIDGIEKKLEKKKIHCFSDYDYRHIMSNYEEYPVRKDQKKLIRKRKAKKYLNIRAGFHIRLSVTGRKNYETWYSEAKICQDYERKLIRCKALLDLYDSMKQDITQSLSKQKLNMKILDKLIIFETFTPAAGSNSFNVTTGP